MRDHAGDAERQMDALRHFQHAQTFRLLAQDLAGLLTVERLADHLSALADVILEADARRRVDRRSAGLATRRPGSPSSATASWAARSWATRPISISCSSTTTRTKSAHRALRAPRAAAHHLAHQRRRPRERSTTSTCACAPMASSGLHGVLARVVPALPAGARVDVGAPGADARALRRRRRRGRRRVRGRARRAPAPAARPRRSSRATSSTCGARWPPGIRTGRALFDLKHDAGGMVDVEFAVQFLVLAHSRTSMRRSRANVGNIALLRIAGELGSSRRRSRSRLPTPTANSAGSSTRSA